MKPNWQHAIVTEYTFAPFTGAWIETFEEKLNDKVGIFAPFTGAWIETQ